MTTPRTGWLTPLAIVVTAAVLLVVFQADVPNGDGRVYIRQITEGGFLWNPNHLLMEPMGLVWFRLTQALGLGWSLFGALKVLAGVSAIAATLIFHRTAVSVARGAPLVALTATAGLFFSAHFVSMAIAEEFFVVQMPAVTGSLWFVSRWVAYMADGQAAKGRRALAAAGALAGLATAIAINNAFLALGLGVGVLFASARPWRNRMLNALTVWIAGVAVAGPIFLAAGLTNASGQSFLQWLLSYQGTADNPAEVMFRVQMTPVGLAVSLATAAYGSVSSLVSPGELGSALEPVVRGRPLEFVPDTAHLAITVLLLLALAAVLLPAALWLVRRGRRAPLEIICLGWLIGYAGFNLYWVDTSDQFFITQLPAFWLLLLLFVCSRVNAAVASPAPSPPKPARSRWAWAMAAAVALLAAVNLQAVVAPRAFMDLESRHAAFVALLRPGDLVVTTGWDDLAWLRVEPGAPYERLQLMDLVLRSRKGDPELDNLPARARAHLASGRRVLVARLYDRDREGRPWEDLERLRWPRPRLQGLFTSFDAVPIGRVDAVVFRELRLRKAP